MLRYLISFWHSKLKLVTIFINFLNDSTLILNHWVRSSISFSMMQRPINSILCRQADAPPTIPCGSRSNSSEFASIHKSEKSSGRSYNRGRDSKERAVLARMLGRASSSHHSVGDRTRRKDDRSDQAGWSPLRVWYEADGRS